MIPFRFFSKWPCFRTLTRSWAPTEGMSSKSVGKNPIIRLQTPTHLQSVQTKQNQQILRKFTSNLKSFRTVLDKLNNTFVGKNRFGQKTNSVKTVSALTPNKLHLNLLSFQKQHVYTHQNINDQTPLDQIPPRQASRNPDRYIYSATEPYSPFICSRNDLMRATFQWELFTLQTRGQQQNSKAFK